MTLAFFDCSCGASGDMILGALVSAGADVEQIARQVNSVVPDPIHLDVSQVTRGGIQATKVDVVCDPGDVHARHLADILGLVENSSLESSAKRDCARIFERLAQAEARVHNCPVEHVHFHEVGAVDSIADIVGSVVGLRLLGVEDVYISAFGLGSGSVHCAHGRLPVPVPATLELIKGFPVTRTGVEGELLTPTGAAVLTTLGGTSAPPTYCCDAVGAGAGSREIAGTANILRVSIGQPASAVDHDSVWVLETNVDDMIAEHVGYLFEAVLEMGALEMFAVPTCMKKGRPGLLLTVIVEDARRESVETRLFEETTTFGIRRRRVERSKLVREFQTVDTSLGQVRVKIGRLNGRICTVSPEYEDCRRLAETAGTPLREIYQQALRAFDAHASGG